MGQRLVEGPLPSGGSQTAFFGEIPRAVALRDNPDHWLAWMGSGESRKMGKLRPSLAETCQGFDRIAIWVDPDPNSYLILFQLVDALKSRTDLLDRMHLAFPSRRVGELSAAGLRKMRPPPQRLTPEQIQLGCLAWRAHHSHTPEAWFGLLSNDLDQLPSMRAMVLRILDELPSARNGLGASERQLLAQFKNAPNNHGAVIGGYIGIQPRATLDYWEIGRRIVSLSRCEPPIILGVGESSFSVELHDDQARFAAYCARRWTLSPIGRRIVEGREDLCAHVSVDRWVGNTHLTSDRLWRWDGTSEALVAPK